MRGGAPWWLLPGGLGSVGAAAIFLWLCPGPVSGVFLREPSEDPSEVEALGPQPSGADEGTLVPGDGIPAEWPGTWPQFRGPDRTNHAPSEVPFARSWPSSGLPALWQVEVGEGHAGPVVSDGRVFLMDYDRDQEKDVVRSLSLKDGREIWRYTYSVKIKRNHGISRTVPAVSDQRVVTLGPKGRVCCLKVDTGELVWKMDLVEECGTQIPPWYAGQCPLIDAGAAILAPGADPLMMAVDLASGQVRWQTPNPDRWGMTHSSIMPMDTQAGRQYVYCTTKGVVGVSSQTGEVLWTKPDWKIAIANVPSPVVVGSDRLFLSGGYKAGSVLVRLTQEGTSMQTEEVFRLEDSLFGTEQQTAILYEGHLYGVISSKEMACLDLKGNRCWTSGLDHTYGLGPFLLVDGLLLALDDQEGSLHMIEANPSQFKELAQAKVLDGHDAWGPMALVGDLLLLRDLTVMKCVRLPRGEG